MQQAKRERNEIILNYSSNKKRKFLNENKSIFENLANEILYEIFDYLDMYHVYRGFFHLNKRFRNLLVNSTLPMKINVCAISKSNFERYYTDMILPNKHRIDFLRLSNPFTVDIIFSPPRILSKFLRLEKLILDHFHTKYLHNILNHLIILPTLHSLVLNPVDYIPNSTILFRHLFRLSKLKFCKLTYRTNDDAPIPFNEFDSSPIEHLIINSRFQFESLNELLYCLPRLRYLSIDYLADNGLTSIESDPFVLRCLKYVSLKLNYVYFNRLEKMIENFFGHIRILRLTTKYDPAYLDAKKWQQLILSSMPKLHIFDLNHEGIVQTNEFTSSFWIERHWFFTYQHNLDCEIFYSTNPYRRKDYRFNWQLDRDRNLNSVEHVIISSNPERNNPMNYFPNAIQLTVRDDFNIPADSITRILNRVVPLKQLKVLIIDCYQLSFEQFIELLRCTSNLHTFKCDFINFYETKQRNESFRYVANRNQIQNIRINTWCTVEDIQWIVDLFPRLEFLKIGIFRKDFVRIIRCLLSTTNNKTPNLVFLCVLGIPKVCLRELNTLIEEENLLDNYVIKYLNHHLYLWW